MVFVKQKDHTEKYSPFMTFVLNHLSSVSYTSFTYWNKDGLGADRTGVDSRHGKVFLFFTASRMEAGSNTSTVILRVVEGDEKGSLESETVKYGREFQGTRTRERLRWQGLAAYTKDRPVLSSERAPHKNKTVNVKQ
jgi:hypothetical protein